MVYSCGWDARVKAWSISNEQLKYEINHVGQPSDIIVGRDGTPLENRIVSIGMQDEVCRISNLETGVQIKSINLGSECWSIAVDKAQTVVAVGTDENVTFIETTNFTKVKEVPLESSVQSLAFNKRNDCMLALTVCEIHSIKFTSVTE